MDSKKTETVPGLFIILDFISVVEEGDLLKFINGQKWTPLTISVDTGRLVQQYGFRFNYHNYGVVADVPAVPDEFGPLIKKVASACSERKLEIGAFNQVIVNQYKGGQGISAHTDWRGFGPVIACATLGEEAKIVFKNGSREVVVVPPRRSLYLMSGEARSSWTHCMPAKKKSGDARVSVTLRHVPDKAIPPKVDV
ncbi:MAG: alpha-ketoglutarate-dependent dioxygenase AlkB [Patescibacteria group bacterium]|nr:alpha-ketoglutarate-dependent dioxygenase AlkB [Patescibacteria group bacterium]